MPIYEYRCSSCGHELESLQKLSDAPLVACPVCKADTLVKLMSAAGFQLKGSGWYATDFKGGRQACRKDPAGDVEGGAGAEVRRRVGRQVRAPKSEARTESKSEPRRRRRNPTATAKSERSQAPASAPATGRVLLTPVTAATRSIDEALPRSPACSSGCRSASRSGCCISLVTTLDQTLLLVPEGLRPEALFGFHIPGLGVLLSFVILLVTGVVAANFFGARLILCGKRCSARIPFVKSIYSSVKQVSDTLLSDTGNAFRKALLVELPRPGCWTIAFLTGTPADAVASHLPGEHVSVYVPTTPNPTGGYFVMVPSSAVRELDMSVDEALKYIISMGVVAPLPGEFRSAPGWARQSP